MLFKSTITLCILLSVFASSFITEAKQIQADNDRQSIKYVPVLDNDFDSNNRQLSPTNQSFFEQKYSSQNQLTATSGSYMTLRRTGKTNALGNPLYKLNLYSNGQLINTFNTVSGRAHTQHRNRHRAGTEAPLPDGSYRVARVAIPGTLVEAGDRFLPIQPRFQTGRSALGIHYDPSYEKNNGEDGTSGCIGLTSRRELSQVLQYVRTHQPQYLEVHIQ